MHELKVVTKGRKPKSPRKRDKVLPYSSTLEPERLEMKFDSPDKVSMAAKSQITEEIPNNERLAAEIAQLNHNLAIEQEDLHGIPEQAHYQEDDQHSAKVIEFLHDLEADEREVDIRRSQPEKLNTL